MAGKARKKKAALRRVGKALKKYVRRATRNPRRVKGNKCAGGRAVTLRNFSGRVIKKRNGQVIIVGRQRKR